MLGGRAVCVHVPVFPEEMHLLKQGFYLVYQVRFPGDFARDAVRPHEITVKRRIYERYPTGGEKYLVRRELVFVNLPWGKSDVPEKFLSIQLPPCGCSRHPIKAPEFLA